MKKQKTILCTLLLFAASLVNAQQAFLKGTVTQEKDGTTLPGANVYLRGTTIGTITNTKGNYTLKKLHPGTYEIVVSYAGMKRIRKTLNLVAGENTQNFTMTQSSHSLGEVVVTGTGTAHHITAAPVATELFTKRKVEAVSSGNFSDLMLNVSPSFDFTQGAMGDFMTLNGLKNDYILILIDGKRLYGDLGGNNDLNRINTDDIERIEVIKGAASLLYGSDAIAGVVNIITKKDKHKVNLTNSSRISKYQTFQQHNALSLNLGRLHSKSSYARTRSNGWQLSPYELITSKKTKKTKRIETDAKNQNAYSTYNLGQQLSYDLTDKLSVHGAASYYQKNYYYPTTVKNYGFFFRDITYSTGAKYLLDKKDFITFDYNRDQNKYYYKYNQAYKSYKKGDKTRNNDQLMEDFQLKYVNSLSHKNTLSLGANYLKEKMTSERVLNGEATAYTLAAYAQDEWSVCRNFDIVAGLRVVKHKEYGVALTPKVSVLYKLGHFNLRGSYGWGFKAPTLKQLYFDYEKRGTLYMGNTDLKPQESEFYSAGVEYHAKIGTLSVTAYRNDIENMIAYTNAEKQADDLSNGIKKRRQFANINKARSQGIDVLLETKLGYGFTLGGGYSYVDAKDRLTGTRLERIAQNYGNIHLDYNHSWVNYKLGINLTGRIQDGKFYEKQSTDAYNIWRLSSTHDFFHIRNFKFQLTAGVDNIFDYVDDNPYGMYHSTLNPGRTFFAGLSINFTN